MKKAACKNCIHWHPLVYEKGIGKCTGITSIKEPSGNETEYSNSIIIRPALSSKQEVFFGGLFSCKKFKAK